MITVLVTVINVVLLWIGEQFFGQIGFTIMAAIMLMTNFLIVRFFLEKYVFRKIKLIYKLIYDSKKDKTIKDINAESLADVNAKVMEWAESTKQEIATLKSLEEYRKNYVGNISHELKTPIFSIQAYLHTLIEGGLYDENINKDYLQRAADNTERLQNIVEDLDVITKLESGQAELDIKKFDLRELVRDIFLDLKAIAKKKRITLQLKEGASQSFFVLADREAIRQVFTNLIINSIKYGKEGGMTKVSFYDMETEILTEISDNGIGIEEKHLKHVFDRFYRVDSSRSRKQGGSGLGLSIVKHIIEAHDQNINVRSTYNVGSTFGFTLKKAVR
ncbi:MAG TPA: ATP-binding protein [Saprospiraceae bacterium]|jgi:two-component system phosphate regulon sensor histidine kinase PhoR|nr:ATP-binding protein [Saprospiraceae bacterium]